MTEVEKAANEYSKCEARPHMEASRRQSFLVGAAWAFERAAKVAEEYPYGEGVTPPREGIADAIRRLGGGEGKHD